MFNDSLPDFEDLLISKCMLANVTTFAPYFAIGSCKSKLTSFTTSACLSSYNKLTTAEHIFMKFSNGQSY